MRYTLPRAEMAYCLAPILGVVGDQLVGFQSRVVGVAGPRIRSGIGSQASADRVEFDIAAAGHEIFIRIDQRGFVASLPQGAAAAIFLIEIRYVITTYPLHHLAQTGLIRRRHQQVQMIRQQNIGMHGDFIGFGGAAQPAEESQIVFAILKNQLVVVAALDDMVRLEGNNETGKAGHDARKLGSETRYYPVLIALSLINFAKRKTPSTLSLLI